MMNIINAKPKYCCEGYSNEVIEALFLVEEFSPRFTYQYYAIDQDTGIYLGQDGDVYNFYAKSKNKAGYGGAEFVLDMQDGSIKYETGLWSSRSGVINQVFNLDLMPVCITQNLGRFNSNWHSHRTYMRQDLVVDILRRYGWPAEVKRTTKWEGEVYFELI